MPSAIAQLRSALAEGPQTAGHLLPVAEAWFATPTRALPLGQGSIEASQALWSIEVGYQAGAGADAYPVDVPVGLDGDRPWFWVGFVRQAADGREAIVLWFEPAPGPLALRAHERWDTGNALGFDFLATAEVGSQALLEAPLVREALDAFGGLGVAAVEVTG